VTNDEPQQTLIAQGKGNAPQQVIVVQIEGDAP